MVAYDVALGVEHGHEFGIALVVEDHVGAADARLHEQNGQSSARIVHVARLIVQSDLKQLLGAVVCPRYAVVVALFSPCTQHKHTHAHNERREHHEHS